MIVEIKFLLGMLHIGNLNYASSIILKFKTVITDK